MALMVDANFNRWKDEERNSEERLKHIEADGTLRPLPG